MATTVKACPRSPTIESCALVMCSPQCDWISTAASCPAQFFAADPHNYNTTAWQRESNATSQNDTIIIYYIEMSNLPKINEHVSPWGARLNMTLILGLVTACHNFPTNPMTVTSFWLGKPKAQTANYWLRISRKFHSAWCECDIK